MLNDMTRENCIGLTVGDAARKKGESGNERRSGSSALVLPHIHSSKLHATLCIDSTYCQYLHFKSFFVELMGLRMDDIHAPTVSSGPTSSGYSNGVSKDKLSLMELIREKERLEQELSALGAVLDSVRLTRER